KNSPAQTGPARAPIEFGPSHTREIAMSSTNQLPRISIIGLGKLGSPMAAVMASKGFQVIGLDLNDKLVSALNKGVAPVEEPQLQEFIDKASSRLRATHSYDEAVKASDVTFIIVPTPSGGDRMFSNKFVIAAIRSIGEALRSKSGGHV